MAKSKKALKALKRRKEAKGRSRVLKERQDYTGGGRVKANVGWAGIPTNIPTQEEIQKQVEEASKQNQQKQEAVVLDEPIDSGGRGTGDGLPEETPTGTPPAQEDQAPPARQWLGLDGNYYSTREEVIKANADFGKPSPTQEDQAPPAQEAPPTDEAPPSGEAPPSDEAPAEEVDRSNIWNLSYEEMNPKKERGDFGAGKKGNDEWQEYLKQYEAAQKWWDSKTPNQRQKGFSNPFDPFGSTGPTGNASGSLNTAGVGDPAQPVLDKIAEDITQYRAKTDNIVTPIQTVKTDLTQDPSTLIADEDIQQLAPIDTVGQRTITPQDLVGTTGTATKATLPGVSPVSLMESEKGIGDFARTAQTDVTREAAADVRTELSERARAADIDTAREEASKAITPTFATPVVEVDPVTGETFTLSATPDAERTARQAITDEEAASGTEAIINSSLGYEAAERRELKGEAAKGAAVSMLEEVGGVPTNIAETILDNPATVTAQIDNNPVEVQAAIAALPEEALVSAQLESLLAGIDEGVTPTWARPAVRLVESRLNARGLNVSTVGRDALFNAIIQTALPIAQSNATALQQRATQNLSNEQQANILQANQDMQLRLTNLANRQTSETQSAQLAQQVNLTQGQLTQQTTLTEAQQQQQVRIQSLQNEQQIELANLGNDQQIELTNLQLEAQRLGANQSAVNQERLAEMQVAASFLQKNGDFKQQMELANMSNEQQMRLAFLTAKNQAEAQNMSAAQQTELTNLNKNLEVNKLNAQLAQQMGLTQLNVDQQSAMANAANVANMNMAQFNADQQIELANSKFMQTMTLQDFTQNQQAIMQNATAMAALDAQTADAITRVSIENARTFLQTDLANLNAEQQSHILNSQQRQQAMLSNQAAENAERQFNATSTNQRDQFMANLGSQMSQFNASQANAMEQFNATEQNRLEAIAANNDLEAQKAEASLNAQIDQYNTSVDFQREQWNAQNEQAVIQSNTTWRRQLNTAETAAENAANQQAANQSFQLTSTEQAFLWQMLRDEATYLRQQYESEQTRKTNLYATALSNESEKAVSARTSTFNIIDSLFGKLGA